MSNIHIPTGIEAIVCQEIAQRQAKGIDKYGTTVANNPLALRDWLQHQYEENGRIGRRPRFQFMQVHAEGCSLGRWRMG